MENIIAQKKCLVCKETLERRNFNKDKSRADGLSCVCRECEHKKSRAYYQKHTDERLFKLKKYRDSNKERLRIAAQERYRADPKRFHGYVKKWTDKNIEHVKGQQKAWRENNKERIKKTVKAWADANKDKRMLSVEKRRALKCASGKIVTASEWKDLKAKYGNKCLGCGRTDVRLTMDHVIPLSLGGKHEIENCQPLCGSCNSTKHTKIVDFRPF